MSDLPSIFPALRYRDAPAAIDWLGRAFGFERHAVYEDDGVVHHAELKVPGGMIMLGTARPPGTDGYSAVAPPPGSAAIYVVVEDTDAHHARAAEAGAEIVMELHDTDYGSRDYTARDPEGNVWSFGTYNPFAA
jgi:uncharacterized glyoxalase superfamily protein PhnB